MQRLGFVSSCLLHLRPTYRRSCHKRYCRSPDLVTWVIPHTLNPEPSCPYQWAQVQPHLPPHHPVDPHPHIDPKLPSTPAHQVPTPQAANTENVGNLGTKMGLSRLPLCRKASPTVVIPTPLVFGGSKLISEKNACELVGVRDGCS